MTGCTCPHPGYCERHRVFKHAIWWDLCRNNEKYFRAWEEGHGPGHIVGVGRPCKPPGGPGTELAKILKWFGITERRGCMCKHHALIMDRWGCDKCLAQVNVIVGWLDEEATKLGLPMSLLLLEKVVQLAIWRARRAERKWWAAQPSS